MHEFRTRRKIEFSDTDLGGVLVLEHGSGLRLEAGKGREQAGGS